MSTAIYTEEGCGSPGKSSLKEKDGKCWIVWHVIHISRRCTTLGKKYGLIISLGVRSILEKTGYLNSNNVKVTQEKCVI